MSVWDKDYGGTQACYCEIRTDPWIEVARRGLQFPTCPEQRRFLFHPDFQNAYGVFSYIFRPLRNLRTQTHYILYSTICVPVNGVLKFVEIFSSNLDQVFLLVPNGKVR